MSRIGKKPVELAEGVEVVIEGKSIAVKGPAGALSMELPEGISVEREGRRLRLACGPGVKNGPALYGTARTLIANMVQGAARGYEKTLQIVGVGYKARVEGQHLILQLGFSHPIDYPFPKSIKIIPGKENTLTVSGPDKQKVGQVAAEIRSFYPPEPYKGKGIRYKDEWVRKKAGKAVATTT